MHASLVKDYVVFLKVIYISQNAIVTNTFKLWVMECGFYPTVNRSIKNLFLSGIGLYL